MPLFAQPDNDDPCDPQLLGTIQLGVPIVISGTNIGATDSNRRHTSARCPDCTNGEVANNTVYYHVLLSQQVSGIEATVTPRNQGRFTVSLECPDICDANPGHYWCDGTSCANANGQIITADGICLLSTSVPACDGRTSGVIIKVYSDTDAQEDDFLLTVRAKEPTFCDGCQNGDETYADGPYSFQTSLQDPDPDTDNGVITITNIEGGNPNYQFSINGGSTQSSPVFSNLPSGQHRVCITDQHDCESCSAYTLINRPAVSPAVQEICEGESVTALTAEGIHVRWYDGNGNTVHSGNTYTPSLPLAGTYRYSVTQTLNNRESTPSTITITVHPAPVVPHATVVPTVEGEQTGYIEVSPTNTSAGPFVYTLSGGEEQGTGRFDNLAAGTYTVQTRTPEGCIQEQTHTVDSYQLPAPTVSNPAPYCADDPIASINATGDQVRWYLDVGLTDLVATGNSFTPSIVTTTTYYVVQQPYNIASEPTAVTITIKPLPNQPRVDIPSPYCTGDPMDPLLVVNPNTEVRWYGDETLSQELATGPSLVLDIFESTSYWVTNTLNGCEGPELEVPVVLIPYPEIDVTDEPYCIDIPITVSSDIPTAAFQWYLTGNPIAAGRDSIYSPRTAGDFTATATNQTCTSYTDTLRVIPRPSRPTVPRIDTICIPDNRVTLTVDSAQETSNYGWYQDEALSDWLTFGPTLEVFDLDTTTTFYVTQWKEGCEGYGQAIPVPVFIPIARFATEPDVGLTPHIVMCLDSSRYARTYSWSFGDGNISSESDPTHEYLAEGTFPVTLEVWFRPDCSSIAYDTVRVFDDLLVPTAITPNGDGQNDVWQIPFIEAFEGNRVRVFDGYGRQVFEEFMYENQWMGGELPEGMYYYLVELGPGIEPYVGYLLIAR